MAIEGMMMRDGNCVAGQDLSNTGALAGPGGSAQYLAVKLSSAADLTVLLETTAAGYAGAGGVNLPYGVLQNKPFTGSAADVCTIGHTKGVYGGTVTAGQLLGTDTSGRFIGLTTAGIAIAKAKTAGVLGDVGTIFFFGGPVVSP